jgi:hypothetical protein
LAAIATPERLAVLYDGAEFAAKEVEGFAHAAPGGEIAPPLDPAA